jgi:HEAT repeat protein
VKRWAEQSAQPQWLGYAVAQIGRDRSMCCGNYDGWSARDCGCRLESGDTGTSVTAGDSSATHGTVKLEGPRNMLVLLRAENKRVMKIRVVSEDCELDAGGLPFVWLSGVKPAESVELLESFVRAGDFNARDGERTTHQALTAIALHADASADRALESFTRPEHVASLRKQAAFWLGSAREKAGLAVLQRLVKTETDTDVRQHLTFALSVSQEPEALPELIHMARDDGSTHVRGQALFWLAHKAGRKAMGALTEAIENDPDTEVKKKAVFALSQMPKEDGVPKLIEVAQNNRNPAVRKQAMFWLGQSHDPRAVAFFEKVLAQ